MELTVIDSDKLDTNNVDNEDSLNLTIGEEEAKIFQDEVINNQISISTHSIYLPCNNDASNDGVLYLFYPGT